MRLDLVILCISVCGVVIMNSVLCEVHEFFTNDNENYTNSSEVKDICDRERLAADSGELNITVKCLEKRIAFELENIVKYAPKTFHIGWLELERLTPVEQDGSRGDKDLLSTAVDDFSRTFVAKVEVIPGFKLRISRSLHSDAFEYGLEWVDSENNVEEGRHRRRRKKHKVKNEELLKVLKLLFIPIVIQSLILPLVLFNINFVAVKALIAGKIAVLLTIFNFIRNSRVRASQDKYTAEISAAHYGYNGGPEYGAWFNGRNLGNELAYESYMYNVSSTR